MSGDIPERAKAAELSNAVSQHDADYWHTDAHTALARLIRQVSDVAAGVEDMCGEHIPWDYRERLKAFILPDPVDPLVEAMRDIQINHQCEPAGFAKLVSETLAKRGLKIVEAQP